MRGSGGMGEVYRARGAQLKRDVAVKVLPPLVVHDPARLSRFQREAEILAALSHSGIATIYGFVESGVSHAIVMEFVEGDTLADLLTQGPVSIDAVQSYAARSLTRSNSRTSTESRTAT